MSDTPPGFTTTVAGRTVVVRTGTKSQTVNVCTSRNVAGDYDVIYRLPISFAIADPADLESRSSLAELGEWLTTDRNAVSEGATGARVAGSLSLVSAPDHDPWVASAIPLAERAIDGVVALFMAAPYGHRVEHSLHVELVIALRANAMLSETVPIGNSGFDAQLVHKEWPETNVRKDRGRTLERRGLFDVVILAPSQLSRATLDQYKQGRIEPPIVIEVGLDYGGEHLSGDIEKFETSRVRHPYLLHLSRVGRRNDSIERKIGDLPTPIQGAYAYHGPDGQAMKRLVDQAVTPEIGEHV